MKDRELKAQRLKSIEEEKRRLGELLNAANEQRTLIMQMRQALEDERGELTKEFAREAGIT